MKRPLTCILIMTFAVSLTLSLTVIGNTKAEAASSADVEAARLKMLEEDHKKKEAQKAARQKEEEKNRREEEVRKTAVAALPAKAKEAGFIALSQHGMHWREAEVFCQQKGGRLPRINNSKKLRCGFGARGVPIEGFGYGDRPWKEVGLPDGAYWTGTESDVSGMCGVFDDRRGHLVGTRMDTYPTLRRAACVR